MDKVRYSGIFEDSYFFLQQNRKIIRQEERSLEEAQKRIQNDFNYYRVLSQDLAKYHAQEIFNKVIRNCVESLEFQPSNGIYGEGDLNLWEEICVYRQKPISCEQSVFYFAVESACFEALKQLGREHYMMLLMSYTDFEEDYYVNGDGCAKHWHEQATPCADGLDKILSVVTGSVYGEAVNNRSENIQKWAY